MRFAELISVLQNKIMLDNNQLLRFTTAGSVDDGEHDDAGHDGDESVQGADGEGGSRDRIPLAHVAAVGEHRAQSQAQSEE